MRTVLKPFHVGINWIALAEYSQMSTHMPGFSHFSAIFASFFMVKLATNNIRVKSVLVIWIDICFQIVFFKYLSEKDGNNIKPFVL